MFYGVLGCGCITEVPSTWTVHDYGTYMIEIHSVGSATIKVWRLGYWLWRLAWWLDCASRWESLLVTGSYISMLSPDVDAKLNSSRGGG